MTEELSNDFTKHLLETTRSEYLVEAEGLIGSWVEIISTSLDMYTRDLQRTKDELYDMQVAFDNSSDDLESLRIVLSGKGLQMGEDDQKVKSRKFGDKMKAPSLADMTCVTDLISSLAFCHMNDHTASNATLSQKLDEFVHQKSLLEQESIEASDMTPVEVCPSVLRSSGRTQPSAYIVLDQDFSRWTQKLQDQFVVDIK